MTVRSTTPGTKAGVVPLETGEYNGGPGGWCGFAKVTAGEGGIVAEELIDGLSVSPTLLADRLYEIQVVVHVKSDASSL